MTTISAPVEVPLTRRPAVRWAAGLVAVVVAVNLIAVALGAFLPSPHGPASSSYATSSRGLAAYAELLGRLGHPVTQLRRPPDAADLPAGATVVLLDPATLVGPSDLAALRAFVAGGGRLVAGGAETGELASALAGRRVAWVTGGGRVAFGDGIAGVRAVVGEGAGRYRCGGGRAGNVLVGAPNRALVCSVRGGRVLLLADSSPLTNRLLARADNAALGVALAGPAGRPVVFIETVHGYGAATGLAALPAGAWWAIALLGLAGLAFLVARWRRLGPAVAADMIPSPPRREHVDALAGALDRADDPDPAQERLRAAAQAIVGRRASLRPHPAPPQLHDAGLALGLTEQDAALLIGEDAGGDELIRLGRLLAHLRTEGT